MHDNLDRVQTVVGHDGVGDLGRDRLDEIPRRARDDVGGQLGQCAVIESVGEIVGGRGPAQIHPCRDVDDELLAVAPFMVENTVVAANP